MTEDDFSFPLKKKKNKKQNSGAGLDDAWTIGPAGPSEQPNVNDTESKVPGLRLSQVPVHRLEHHGEPRARGARIRSKLRQLLPNAWRAAQHPLFPTVRESISEFGEPRAESSGGQLQRETRGSQAGQQRLEALLRAGR